MGTYPELERRLSELEALQSAGAGDLKLREAIVRSKAEMAALLEKQQGYQDKLQEAIIVNRVLKVFVEEQDEYLFDKVLSIVLKDIASSYGVFGYINEPGDLVCHGPSKMLDNCEVEGNRIHYPREKWKGLWGRALTEKKSFFSNEPPPVPPGYPVIHNNLAAPILFRGDAIGLLNIANKEGGYSEKHRQILDSICVTIAPFLHTWINRKLHEEERKQAEEMLRQSHDELEAIYNGMPGGLLIADAETKRFTKTNPAMCRMLGYSEDELLSMSVNNIHPKTALQEVLGRFQEGTEGRLDLAEDVPLLRKDGVVLYADVAIKRLAYKERPCLIGFFHDLTKRRQNQEAIRQSQMDLKRAQEVAQIGSWRLDVRNNILTWSDESYSICDIPKGTPLTYEKFLEIVHPDDRDYVDRKWKAALRGKPYDIEHRIEAGDQLKWLREKAFLEFDDKHELLGGFGIAQDITERKHMEDELRRSRDELELRVEQRTGELSDALRKLKERSEQLRRMSVELTLSEQRERKKLGNMLHDGLQQVLVGAKFQVEFIERGHRTSDDFLRLKGILEEAINASRSLALELHPPILLRNDLSAALRWLADWKRKKYGLRVKTKCPENLQSLDYEVTLLLFQSVRELLFNIVKHAGVKEASVELSQPDRRILLTIEDKGAGFDSNEIRLGGDSRGFGLVSVRERLSSIGGHMEIESAPGEGTRIGLVIPLSNATKEMAQESIVEPASNDAVALSSQRSKRADTDMKIRIMLTDDHGIVRQGVANLMGRESDFEIVGEASNGKSAVDLVREIHPDVVLMDVDMPEMDGIEATRRIHNEFPDISIIGFSIHDEESQRKAMLEAGAVRYFAKRGSLKDLAAIIRACTRGTPS